MVRIRNAGSSRTTPTLFQSGTYDLDTNYRWLPSIAMDKDGNIALGYSKSSTSVFPGIYITGRLATDTARHNGRRVLMRAGIGVQLGAGIAGATTAHDPRPHRPMHLLLYERVLKDEWGLQLVYPDRCLLPVLRLGRGLWGTVTGTSLHRKQALRFLE